MKSFIAFALLVSAPLSAHAADMVQCFSANGTIMVEGKFTEVTVNWLNNGPAVHISAKDYQGKDVYMSCAYFNKIEGV